jgi:hypothetical protein
MLGRLKRSTFLEAERIGKAQKLTVVRALHPTHGWMYEKIAEANEAASDAAVDAWAARANKPAGKPKRIGAK